MEVNGSDGGSPATENMTTVSNHYFGDSDDGISITVIESMKEEYGLFVWPSSVILAEYVWQQRSRLFAGGVNVVELGAGTSLPGLVAAKVGANVILTDDSDRLEVLDNMRRVCELNSIKCESRPLTRRAQINWNRAAANKRLVHDYVLENPVYGDKTFRLRFPVIGLTWGVWNESIFSLRPQVILGADVLYDSSAFNSLFATVTFLLEKSPGSVFITSYHNRSGHHLIEFLMVKWGLKCVKLIDGFSFLPASKASGLSGNIQLVEIGLNDAGKN